MTPPATGFTYTSSPSKWNSLDNRTAWLRPFCSLKPLAFLVRRAIKPSSTEMAIDEFRRRALRLVQRGLDHAVVRRQRAHRIGAAGIAGQQKGLTAATTPIDLAPVAAAARLGHPVGAAISIEGLRAVPDVGESAVTDGRKVETR